MAADESAETTTGYSPEATPTPTGEGIAMNDQEFAALARLQSRRAVASYLGQQFGGDRDIYDVAGYDKTLSTEKYWAKYLRQDIARTIVDAPAKATWKEAPVITDDPETTGTSTPFDEAIDRLFDDYGLLRMLERVDRLAGLGKFAVMYLGLGDADDADLDQEVVPGAFQSLDTVTDPFDSGLAFLKPYSERRIDAVASETDVRDPRFGLPKLYSIDFGKTADSESNTKDVHYSRVIHFAEDILQDEVEGVPRLMAVYNRLEDLEKVIAASAEGYWRTASPRWKASTAEGTQDFSDKDALKNEIESMIHGMDLVAYLRNVDLEPIPGEVVDPSGIIDSLLQLIAGETGIPKRMLTGSERGELASTQDRATFYDRIHERQEKAAEPGLLRPVIDRLIEFGILPEPADGTYEIEWPDMFELNEVERAQVRKENTASLKNAAAMGDPSEVASLEERREEFLGLAPEYGTSTTATTVDGGDGQAVNLLDLEDARIVAMLDDLPADATAELDRLVAEADAEGDA